MSKITGYNKVAIIEQGSGCCKRDYFYALYDENIYCGDMVLVTGTASGQVWEVKGVIDKDDSAIKSNITAEVICRVDITDYERRCDNRKKAEELRKQMDKKRKEIEARKDDEYYASLDPEYKAMLEQMREIVG